MFTVMVKWSDAKRAERLANGTTTTRKFYATMFRSQADAERAARQSLDGIAGIDRWWVAPF